MSNKGKVLESREIYEYSISLQGLSDIIQEFLKYDTPYWEIDHESGVLYLGGWRPENDAERRRRLDKEKREREKREVKKAIQEANERAQLAKLLEKYGVPNDEISQ